MADIPSTSELTALAGFLSPGVVILWVRNRFRTANPPKLGEQIISLALLSVAYRTAVYPLFHANSGVQLPSWLWQILLGFGAPLAIACAIVVVDRCGVFYKLANRLGLRPSHHEPTAWDYSFRNRLPSYLLVHLEDGSTVAGTWSDGAFASTKAGDRDLLIDHLWKVSETGSWEPVEPRRSLLICAGSIRMVEFIQGGAS